MKRLLWAVFGLAVAASGAVTAYRAQRRDRVVTYRGVRIEIAHGAVVDVEQVRRSIRAHREMLQRQSRWGHLKPGHLLPATLRYVRKRPRPPTATTTGRAFTNPDTRKAVIWSGAPLETTDHELWHLTLLNAHPSWGLEEHHDFMRRIGVMR